VTASADARYARDMVERLDRDRFLLLRLVPEDRQDALATLFAFNLEVARVRETVSETMLGEIRLQWWRDALDGIEAGTPRHHPVVQGLARTIATHDLPRALFDRLIDARARDLDDSPFVTVREQEDYLDATNGGLMVLAGRILGAGDRASEATLRAIGLAHGLTGLMRAMPVLLQLRRAVLSLDAMAEAGVGPDALQAARPGPQLRPAVEACVRRAEKTLARARSHSRRADKSIRPLCALGAVARHAAGRLRRADYDPFDPRMAPEDGIPLSVTLRILFGRW